MISPSPESADPSNSPTGPLGVLVVDDEANIRKALTACLEAEGHSVTAVANAKDAIAAAGKRSFDLALVDLNLGGDRGIDLIPTLLADSPWMKVVVLTAYAAVDTAVESMRRGATDYLAKPFTPDQLRIVTQRVAQLRAMEQNLAGLREALGEAGPEADLSTVCPAVERVLTMARQVAASDATVLIRGESGTGKGVLAKAIHAWSGRASKRFSVVACPALSAELLESELFGHVKGSFTGAVRDNPGRIASSEGGTLFLDEIGDLPARLQPKLLRFVQDREYERVGDQTTRKADVRLIAATNVDLELAVKEGRFREDLLYRLNVIQLRLPALRERKEDLIPLAERLLAWFGRKRPTPQRLSAAAAQSLRAYAWPGNIRELRNVLERASILAGIEVGPEHLGLDAQPARNTPAVGDPIPLEQLEELHIKAVLASAPTIDEAARILGMDTVTLWRRRKKFAGE